MYESESFAGISVEGMARFSSNEIILSEEDELRVLRTYARKSSQQTDRANNY